MTKFKKPTRAHVVLIKIEGDTWNDVIAGLYSILRAQELEGPTLTTVSGGYSFSWIWDYKKDESITHDDYFAAINKRLDEIKNQDVFDK